MWVSCSLISKCLVCLVYVCLWRCECLFFFWVEQYLLVWHVHDFEGGYEENIMICIEQNFNDCLRKDLKVCPWLDFLVHLQHEFCGWLGQYFFFVLVKNLWSGSNKICWVPRTGWFGVLSLNIMNRIFCFVSCRIFWVASNSIFLWMHPTRFFCFGFQHTVFSLLPRKSFCF